MSLSASFSHGKITLLLTMPEDKATLRSDLSAGMEVSGKSSADALLFFLVWHICSSWKPKSDKPEGERGLAPFIADIGALYEKLVLLSCCIPVERRFL